MPEEFRERTVLIFKVSIGKIGSQASAHSFTLNGVTGGASLNTILQSRLSVEQLAASFYICRGGGFGMALVRGFNVRPADRYVAKDVFDLLVGEVGPVRHALLFVLGKQRRGNLIAGLDYVGRSIDELEQPFRLAPLIHVLQIGAYLDPFSVGMARGAALIKGGSCFLRELCPAGVVIVVGPGSL